MPGKPTFSGSKKIQLYFFFMEHKMLIGSLKLVDPILRLIIWADPIQESQNPHKICSHLHSTRRL